MIGFENRINFIFWQQILAVRLIAVGPGYAAILEKHKHLRLDFMIPYNFLGRAFSLFIRDCYDVSSGILKIYLDGSKFVGNVGCVIFFKDSDVWPLQHLQAEVVTAILAEWRYFS